MLSTADIQNWLISYVAQLLEIEFDEIDIAVSFNRYGMDSSMTLDMISHLEEWMGCELEPTLVYNYPTIESLAERVSSTS